MLGVGCSTPELRVDNECLMAGPHPFYAHVGVSTTGTAPNGERDIIPLLEELRRFNTTSLRQLV